MKKPDVRGFFDPVTSTWTYVVYAEDHVDKNCAIIDSVLDYDIYSSQVQTTSADEVIQFIKQKGLNVQWILETHIHADHLTGAAYIKEKLGGKIGISKYILEVFKTWEPLFNERPYDFRNGPSFDHQFDHNESFTVGPFKARILHTPGHTPVDSTYIIGDAVFVGDLIFMPDVGTGRYDFSGGSAEQSYDSSRKILSWPGDYRLYVGHDYPPADSRLPQCMATIAEQKRSNIRVRDGISKDEYVTKRNQDDKGKKIPKLLLPSIQVNLRAGNFSHTLDGAKYIKLPINSLRQILN